MNKVQWLRIVNAILFLSVLAQAITIVIFVLELELPRMKIYFLMHKYNGLFLMSIAVVHLALNWNWVKATYFPKKVKA